MATKNTTPAPAPTPVATDVFNPANVDPFLKPDKILADLEAKLRKATDAEAAAIQKQIDARQAELSAQYGSVGFGSGGYVIPNYAYSDTSGSQYGDLLAQQNATAAALAGKMQLAPTGSYYTDPVTGQSTNLNPIYQAQYYGPQGQVGWVKDPVTGELMDPYAYGQKQTLAGLAGTTDPKSLIRKFYDASGNELSPEQVAKTAQGIGQARAGWDIGFGPGMLAGGVNAKTLSDDQLRGLTVNNLAASGELKITGYDPATGQNVPVNGAGATSTVGNTATPTASNMGVNAPVNAARKSAYDTLYNEFNKYGLGSLVDSIKGLITDANTSPSELSIALQNTKEYQQRFSANQDRIKAGLVALTPAEYITLEDQYQNIMRNYGLPSSYYSKDTLGTQSGFNKLLSNDVSAAELEDRIATAQQRVQNSNPEVLQALKQFYPDISNADILSYALDPQNALTNIKRKVTAAEIGGAALAQGLQANGGTAESLAGLGITKAQAQQGYTDIAGILPRGSQLADIYGQTPYTQGTAEAEVFNTAGAAAAAAKRKKLSDLEKASFSGSSGVGALGRDKNIYGAAYGQSGLY
jgi:hypothetical protein